MTWPRWATGVAILVAVNAFVLARVGANRVGAPDSRMTLTERELPRVQKYESRERSGVGFSVDVHHWIPYIPGKERHLSRLNPGEWVPPEKLEEVGFDLDEWARLRKRGERDRWAPPARRAWAALEMEGPAWERYRKELAKRFDVDVVTVVSGACGDGTRDRDDACRELVGGSRLFIVDVGRDPAALRARYPDRRMYLVAPVKVGVDAWFGMPDPDAGESAKPHGYARLLIDELDVPLRLQGAIPPVPKPGGYRWAAHPPDYEVDVANGARFEPWIEAIRSHNP